MDHLLFTRDVIARRRSYPAMSRYNVNAFYTCDRDWFMAYHRRIEGIGADVIVVRSLNDSTWWDTRSAFPVVGIGRRHSTGTLTTTG